MLSRTRAGDRAARFIDSLAERVIEQSFRKRSGSTCDKTDAAEHVGDDEACRRARPGRSLVVHELGDRTIARGHAENVPVVARTRAAPLVQTAEGDARAPG